MRRLLALSLILLFTYQVYKDMNRVEERREQLRAESLEGKPDPNRRVAHWDWETGTWVYKDQIVKPSGEVPGFRPSIDSSMVEEREGYEVYIDPDLKPYVQLFFEYNYRFGRPIIIDYKNVYIYFHTKIAQEGAAGQCFNSETSFEVRIDPGDWNAYPKHREALVFHELGHCILGRGHLDDMVFKESSEMPQSIMHSQWHAYRIFYDHYKNYYLEELFNY